MKKKIVKMIKNVQQLLVEKRKRNQDDEVDREVVIKNVNVKGNVNESVNVNEKKNVKESVNVNAKENVKKKRNAKGNNNDN